MKEQVAGTAQVPILVATTRKKAIEDPGEMFGGDRADALSYAAITVSIPPEPIARSDTCNGRPPCPAIRSAIS